MRFGDPLPRPWRYAAVIAAVLLVFGLGDVQKSGLVGGVMIAIGVGLAVGVVARVIYTRRHG